MSHAKVERNKRIIEMYDDTTRKYTFRALANMFQISEAAVRKIYFREKKKMQKLEENKQ